MSEPLVIGLDSSTQSTKAIAWNQAGTAVAEGRADIAMDNPRLDCFEQNPSNWWQSAITALKACADQVDAAAVAGIAISNQRETLAFLDSQGRPTYPAITWLDERSRLEVVELSQRFGGDNIHRITGRPPDITPCLYRFLWLQKNEPEAWKKTAHFVDVRPDGHCRYGIQNVVRATIRCPIT